MSDRNHLYLVDGSGYIFRAYHRMPPLTNPQGTPVGAVYGYTTMLWKLARDLHAARGPTHLAVVLDHSSHSFRNEIYPEYKANRPPPPEDLVPQFPLIREATQAFSLPCIEQEGFEADDLIASYCEAAHRAGWDVTIVSSDKDLMQLVRDSDSIADSEDSSQSAGASSAAGIAAVDMLDSMKNIRFAEAQVAEKFGVAPARLGDVLALMGDSVDNIPGVPGVGPKTAAKLIGEYGTLEAVLTAAPDMKQGKLRESLIDFAEQARLSRLLVELKRDIDLPQSLESLRLEAIPPDPLRQFLEQQGFRSQLARLNELASTSGAGDSTSASLGTGGEGSAGDSPQVSHATQGMVADAIAKIENPSDSPPIDRTVYHCVTDLAALQEWISEARATHYVAIDTETASLDSVTGRLVGLSLATAPNRACYIPLGHNSADIFADAVAQIPLDSALAALAPLLADDSVLKIGHNIKYDMGVLAQHGLTIAPYDDTLAMSFALNAGKHGHSLDELATRYLNHSCLAFKDVCGSGKKQLSFADVPLAQATEYAAEDVDVTLRLWQRFTSRLAAEGGSRVYHMVDRPLIAVLEAMERRGILVDKARLAKLSQDFERELEVIEADIHKEAGKVFTIGSPKQLGQVLFEDMKLKGKRKGKGGDYSTDQGEMERLERAGVPIARMILEWRQLAKLKSTYSDALQTQINAQSGRVHTSYNLAGAQTGRLSSSDPNLQNIPIRTPIGRQIRECFITTSKNVLLSADYSQIELRLAAHIADVDALKQAFQRGEDIHAATAVELYGALDRDTRARAKTINFSLLYGISRWGLAARLETTPDEAQDLINRYFERFPGIADYIRNTLESARSCGYTETLFGRKTYFPRLTSSDRRIREANERAAINAPIQGTSADIIKRAMARLPQALAAAGLSEVAMLLQVHDELLFELPEAQVESASKIIREVMMNAAEPMVQISVPLDVDIGVGTSWDAAH